MSNGVRGGDVHGDAAFRAFCRLLEGEVPQVHPRFAEPIFNRAWSVLCAAAGAGKTSSMELAVLVRQVLRFQELTARRPDGAMAIVRERAGWPSEDEWRAAGVATERLTDGSLLLRARPWQPAWLPGAAMLAEGVEGPAMARTRRKHFPTAQGDPFLRRVYDPAYLARLSTLAYLSAGQRAVVRAALTTPPGATLAVCLPTGDGKSLMFHALARIGMGTSAPGVTVVAVPTRALAQDQEETAVAQLGLPRPLAHLGGREAANRTIEDAIRHGRQALCFASPEAIVGSLKPALFEAARRGHLRSLVVDEAHLVDAWGVNFRPEFQIMAGIRRDLLKEMPAARRFTTLLLSATLTESSLDTLRRFFGPVADDDPPFEICAAARLRPEPAYFVAGTVAPEERDRRVREALAHVPRPAILYVTQRKDADRWFDELVGLGYRRVGRVHGESSDMERSAVIRGWRDGSLDLVVATSAFGLGIDNRDVRTIIHACIPETLDRFYQEVGRGGRDGCASLSLLLPAWGDERLARGLNRPTLIGVERGLERWTAMLGHPSTTEHGKGRLSLRLDVPPGVAQADLDMLNEQSTQWNARTLNLMASAGLLTLEGVASDVPTERGQVWQTVQIRDDRTREASVWHTYVEPRRSDLAQAAERSLKQMDGFLRGEACASHLLTDLYRVSGVGPAARPLIEVSGACGGCPFCRATGRGCWGSPGPEPAPPWPGTDPSPAAARLFTVFPRLLTLYPAKPTPAQASLQQGVSALVAHGFRNLILCGDVPLDLEQVDQLAPAPVFVSRSLLHRLPKGPTVIVTAAKSQIGPGELARPLDDWAPAIYLVPEDALDPDRAPHGVPLTATCPVGWRRLDDVILTLSKATDERENV